MINIFVTYRCNLACPYCFARDLQQDFQHDMQEAEFDRLLTWMSRARVTAAAFIGGEPTLHPRLAEMISMTSGAGISVTLFTNGLFPTSLVQDLAPHVTNFVVNYNDPQIYSHPSQKELLHANLNALTQAGCRITFSKNFTPACLDYDYLIEGARKYGVAAIRYDISRPGTNGTNDYFTANQTTDLMTHVVRFVRACEEVGIRTGLDCCLKFCDLSMSDRAYLERVSMKLTGICHPSIDIHPDLSASYCLPLRHVAVQDVTEFVNCERLTHHFASAVRPARFENVSAECLDCPDFRKKCQGGCMALKAVDAGENFKFPHQQPCHEVNHE